MVQSDASPEDCETSCTLEQSYADARVVRDLLFLGVPAMEHLSNGEELRKRCLEQKAQLEAIRRWMLHYAIANFERSRHV